MGSARSFVPPAVAIALLYGVILLAGCRSERVAKQVAELRRSGKVEAARKTALEELQKSPDQLPVWRELAATDLAICERPSSSGTAGSYPLLTEAALLCTAVYESGKMDEKWRSVASRVAALTATAANQILNQVDVETVRGKTHLKSEPLTAVELESERFVDPEDMEWTVQHAVPLIFFTRRLGPVLSQSMDSNVQILEKRLAQMAQNTNISEDQLNSSCKRIEEKTASSLAAAAGDLNGPGYFEYETIIPNPALQ